MRVHGPGFSLAEKGRDHFMPLEASTHQRSNAPGARADERRKTAHPKWGSAHRSKPAPPGFGICGLELTGF